MMKCVGIQYDAGFRHILYFFKLKKQKIFETFHESKHMIVNNKT